MENKVFEVNKKSWHWKIIKLWNSKKYEQIEFERNRQDFCSYWGGFVLSLFGVIFMTFMVLLFLAFCLMAIFIVGNSIYMYPIYSLSILASISTITVIYFGAIALMERNIDKEHKPDGLFKTKYKSIKHKFCPAVVYKDE